MKKILAASIIILCIASASFAQLAYNNAFSIGNTADDAGYSIAGDAAGNYYCTGNYTYWVDIDPGSATQYLTSLGGLDAYVAKYNSSGILQWAFTIGGIGDDYIFSIKTDMSNNVFVAGRFQSTVDFDPGTGSSSSTSAGGNDIFLAKYDANGNYQWVIEAGGSDDDEATEAAYDAVGNNILLTGSFESAAVDMDATGGTQTITNLSTAGFGYTDAFVASYNAGNGSCNWAFGLGGNQGEDGNGVTTDNAGNVFVTGDFSSLNVDFDPGNGTQLLSSGGSAEIYIAKYNSSGAYQWAHRIGEQGGDIGYSVACDDNGNVYSGGYFNSDSVDFDTGAGTNYIYTGGVQDLFVIKLNNSGVYQWAFGVGDFNSEVAQDLAVTGGGDIFITGSFGHTVDFDPDLSGTFNLVGDPTQDGYLAQYDTDGNFVDAIPFTGNGYEFGIGIALIPPNKVGVTGWFSSATVDFDPGPGVQNLSVTGGLINWTDAFVATYAYAPSGFAELAGNDFQFTVFPNPADESLVIRHRAISEGFVELKIFDIMGKEVFSESALTLDFKLLTLNFPSGIYYIKLSSRSQTASQKLIVQH